MSKPIIESPTLAVIYGNRDFFPDQLVTEARADVAKLFAQFGIKAVQLGENDSKLGGVETHGDARKCAELFRKHADEVDGILVCLPNFGDEKGVADTLKLAGLNVPVLIQGYPDDLDQLSPARRRDAFCGKISVCNNLVQAGELERVGHALFVTEVRQANEDAVDLVRVLPKELGALARISVRLDAAELGVVLAELDRLDAELGEELRHVRPRFRDELVWEKIAVAVNDPGQGRHSLIDVSIDLTEFGRWVNPGWKVNGSCVGDLRQSRRLPLDGSPSRSTLSNVGFPREHAIVGAASSTSGVVGLLGFITAIYPVHCRAWCAVIERRG